jgi:hypothetical protein
MVASADFAHDPIEFMRSHVVTCSKMPPGAQLEGKGRSRRQPLRVGAFGFYGRGVFELIYCRDETEGIVTLSRRASPNQEERRAKAHIAWRTHVSCCQTLKASDLNDR